MDGSILDSTSSQVLNVSGLAATEFFEIVEGDPLLDSHPDFSGAQLTFGFCLQHLLFGPDDLAGLAAVSSDDVSVRFNYIPSPGALAAFAVLGLVCLRRRRM